MTLHTRVKVMSPGIDPRETFVKMRQIIGAGEQYSAWESPQMDSENEYRHTMSPGFHMDLGQGLPALLWVDHWRGELEPAHEHDKFCYEWDESGSPTDKLECDPEPRGYIEINYDTAYGYRADNNASCSDLHAWITQEIGAWLDRHGATWEWYDESGDGWGHGPGWGTLGDPEVGALGSTKRRVDGDEKRSFFAVAMAAIAADLNANGGQS